MRRPNGVGCTRLEMVEVEIWSDGRVMVYDHNPNVELGERRAVLRPNRVELKRTGWR